MIIAEKPSVALRIAMALGNGGQKRIANGRVSYFQIDTPESTIYVVAAVGHLFTLRQKGNSREYPILDVEWAPSYLVNKSSAFTKAYLDVVRSVGAKCSRFINACDYDTEGTVIGMNIIKEITGERPETLGERARRMKFSTTTTPDLLESFSNLTELDVTNFYAGEVRHTLDWLWGINLSRALTSALKRYDHGKQLSIGRVQGPTLAVLAKRELEITDFKPTPYWKISVTIKGVNFINDRKDIADESAAETALSETVEHIGEARITSIERRDEQKYPYPPFDLTSLQMEASRAFKMDPSVTLSTAQSLYERSYISYPRTSSQKLPPTLGLNKIIESIAKIDEYREPAERLIRERRFRPVQGQKVDDAHPAIFPTGVEPKKLTEDERKVYDIIVRRFLSCFAEPAEITRVRVSAQIGKEGYSTDGARLKRAGWLDIYRYVKLDEKDVDLFEDNESCIAESPKKDRLETKPPRRFTKASLIAELERVDLGTKATRASIIDTLFKRNYIEGSQIRVTSFGMTVYKTLSKSCEMIVNIETTRVLEEDMELISKGKRDADEVIVEGKRMLIEAITLFDKNKESIGEQMRDSFREVNTLGRCPKCGGDLIIRRSKIGKQFVACSNYPKCTNTYPLPQNAKILSTTEVCDVCKTPMVRVIRKGKPPFDIDLDPKCTARTIIFPAKAAKQGVAERAKIPEPTDRAEPTAKPAKSTPKRGRSKRGSKSPSKSSSKRSPTKRG